MQCSLNENRLDIMKKKIFVFVFILSFTMCGEDNFWERFGPEVLFYQYDYVETADFIDITLESGITEYLLKARVSAPNKLAQIDIYRDEALIRNITDFSESSKPTEYFLSELVTNIVQTTIIRVTAIDSNGKEYSKEFTIRK